VPFHRVRDPERLQALIDAMLVVAADLDLTVVLRTITGRAVDLVDARFGAMGVLDASRTGLAEFVTVGLEPEETAAIGRLPSGKGILGLLIREPRPVRLRDLGEHPERSGFPPAHPHMRSFLGVPVSVGDEVYGNLYLCDKRDAEEFTEEDEDVVAALALAAGLAIDKARLYARLRQLTLTEERERIARDLHGHVIQRLFAVGLSLQGAARLEGLPGAGIRLHEAIDELDDTIGQIRSTVFAMQVPPQRQGSGVRGDVLAAVDGATGGLSGLETTVDLDGPLDELGPQLIDTLLLSVREAVAAAVRRPGVHRIDVELSATETTVELRVLDDAPGAEALIDAVPGLEALTERAKLHGGSCELRPRLGGGSELLWRVRVRSAG